MQNLTSIRHRIVQFGDESAPLTATTWDPSDDSILCAFGPSESSPLLALKRLDKDSFNPEQALSIAAWDAPSPSPDLDVDQIIDLHCFSDTKTIAVILAGGDIVIVREEPQPGEDVVEIVGSVDAGIAAVSWSPDEELVLIATKADTILLMTRDFESTANIALSVEDLEVSNHVSVGWGKSETQFKGRGAKALRDPTVPEHIDEGTLSASDDGRVSVSWRGDGQYVAVNSVLDTERKRRIIRIYSREGVLESVSEAVNGLESALSWKPSGQTIAGVQRREIGVDIVFFERNGLRHGEFSLRLGSAEADALATSIQLDWNSDSTVLAVTMIDRVQLWTPGNYHWYLKQEVRLDRDKRIPFPVTWHTERPFHLACADGTSLHALAYVSEYGRGSVKPSHDQGLIAVIDGNKLNITPLRTANIPPPMAFDELELPDNAVDVAFNVSGTRLAVLHHESVSTFECDYSSRPAKKARLVKSLSLGNPQHSSSRPRQITSECDDAVCVLLDTANTQRSLVKFYHNTSQRAASEHSLHRTVSIFKDSDNDRSYCYLENNNVQSLNELENGHDKQDIVGSLPVLCTSVEVWRSAARDILVGITASGMLHVQNEEQKLRIPGCTSFSITPSHLIFTTSQHLLKFVHLHDGDVEIPADEPEKDERCRNIERGAKLVTVMPSAYALILQMPRGNLETIYPRALVLARIRRCILDRDYKGAFSICRSQRVDMNILHDYAPEQFMLDVELFVRQVKKVEYLDLFLSSLTEDNVAETRYKETLRLPASERFIRGAETAGKSTESASPRSKVNGICNAFLKCLEQQLPKYLQSVITAHVCKSPPDLVSGLSLVARLQQQGDDEQLEQAVEHICFLADVNQLYDTALGMYELGVTLLVAQQSQRDPREYIPYLQSLQDMEPRRRQFSIDNDLKRYGKALIHLHALSAFDELTAFVEKHELYEHAIELYRHDRTRLQLLMRLYANFLITRNKYSDAGFAYEYIQDYQAAYEAYRSASLWRESLTAAAMVPVSDDDLQSLAQDLADASEEAKEFVPAATIHLEYLDDLRNALRLHCKAYQFAEAMRLATVKKQPELITKIIEPGLIECSASMMELLAEMKGQIQAQVPRLRELREKKAENPMAFLDGGDVVDTDIPDNLSIAPTDASTSGGTFMTRYTNRSMGTLATNATHKTSKNRRREERKRARGKKGTVYEEEYLVNSIARLIERLNTVSEDVARLVEGLMRRTMRERAVAVQAAMLEVQEVCRQCMDDVFETAKEPVAVNGAQEGLDLQQKRPWGGQGVLWDSISASRQKIEPPLLRSFQRLSILGSPS